MADLDDALRRVVREELRAVLAEYEAARAMESSATGDDAKRRVFTMPELAQRWRCSGSFLRQLRDQQKLTVTKFGTKVMVTVEEVFRLERVGVPSSGIGRRRGGRSAPVLPVPAPAAAE